MTNARADAKQEMSELIKRQTDVSISLANLEKQIYNFETTYLEEAMEHGGNVIRGFGKLLESVNGSASSFSAAAASSSSSSIFSAASANAKLKKAPKQKFEETDRIFSLSSVTSPISARMLELGIGIAATTERNSPNGLSRDNVLVNGDKPPGRPPPHSVRAAPLHSQQQSTRKESSQEELMAMEEPTSDDEEGAAGAAGRRGPAPKRRRTFAEH